MAVIWERESSTGGSEHVDKGRSYFVAPPSAGNLNLKIRVCLQHYTKEKNVAHASFPLSIVYGYVATVVRGP